MLMFLFQIQKQKEPKEPDFSAWEAPKGTKQGEKVVSNLVHWAIMNMPVDLLNKAVGGDYGKGLKCIVHYLNASGEPLKLEFTKKEWEFILEQTRSDWFNPQSDMKEYYQHISRDPLSQQIKWTMLKWTTLDGANAKDYNTDMKEFEARMKRSGHDLGQLMDEMKVGESREIIDSKGRPYLVYKDEYNGKKEIYLSVFYNRRWLSADKDGWEKMHMVPAGGQPSDAWNVAGFTTVARRKREGGGWDYRIEEQFDFEGSRSQPIVYTREVSSAFASAAKTVFPFLSVQEGNNPGMSYLIVNSQWIETVGKPFKLDISMWMDKNGQVHPGGEEAPVRQTSYFMHGR